MLNTDQGSPFTSEIFTRAVIIKEAGSQLSMDGKVKAIGNVFIGRLWRSARYEFIDDNTDRRHTALNDEFQEPVYKFYKPKAPEAAEQT